MKKLVAFLAVAAVMSYVGSIRAEEGQGNAEKPAKAAAAKSFKGVLGAKAADAAADVIGVLTMKGKDGEKKVNLTSSDAALAEKAKGLVDKHVKVAGQMNAEGTAIAATAIDEVVARPHAGKEKKEKAPAAGEQ